MRITHTATGRKEDLEPVKAGHVGLYECGPTVYDAAHVGHARPMVVFDVLRRYLTHAGLKVVHVKNITDIEDKIINRAAQEGVSCQELTAKWEKDYWELSGLLGVLPPDEKPRATEHIPEMIAMIEQLLKKGLAYEGQGSVYFPVRDFPSYGSLSHRTLEGMSQSGEDPKDAGKKDPLDFALWKVSKPGEPSWDSPWGPGRPG